MPLYLFQPFIAARAWTPPTRLARDQACRQSLLLVVGWTKLFNAISSPLRLLLPIALFAFSSAFVFDFAQRQYRHHRSLLAGMGDLAGSTATGLVVFVRLVLAAAAMKMVPLVFLLCLCFVVR